MTTTKRSQPSSSTGKDLTAEVAFLTRALKAPTLREAVPRLADRARAEAWTHEEFLVACLQREVSARESHGGEGRIRAARFPARKSLEEFDFEHARGLKRDLATSSRPDTASSSPPHPSGWPGSPTPTTPGDSKTSWSDSAATR